MSFKYSLKNFSDCHYVLDVGVPSSVDVFMSDKLIQDSEEKFWQEVVTIANFPGVTKTVVTPDGHASGNGIPVGVAVETEGTVIPCAAGYDISCGMAAVRTRLTVGDLTEDRKVRAWIDAVLSRVAIGAGRSQAPKQRKFSDKELRDILLHGATAITANKRILGNLERTSLPVDAGSLEKIERAQRGIYQIGSLGGGNHFLELDVDQNGDVWILIHTGSRGFGHATAEWFFHLGAKKLGLRSHDKEKCWFDTDSAIGRSYINHMNAAANFAIANRLVLFQSVEIATNEVLGSDVELFYEISHNLVQTENGRLVHRKGATRAFPAGHPALVGTSWMHSGHPIIIPGSMQTASAILFAMEKAAKSLFSINHGCGRVLGRGQAKKVLAEHQEAIDLEMHDLGILINSRRTPLEECGRAYKGIDEVLYSVETAGLAKVAYKLRPRAVIKGDD